jgi:glycosyltransferase involved in cell wall biosynthesis
MNTLLVGAMTGLIAGLLFNPQTGKKTREIFKERFSFLRDGSKRRGSMNEGWMGGTNDGGTEKSLVGVDEAFGRPVPPEMLEEVKRTYGLPDHFFLYCGQIYPPKNFGRLIQAYAQVGPELGISLVVAGGHTWLCEDEIALIDQLGIKDRIHFTGWVSHDHLPAFYALAEALVLPSLYESFGIPLLEAMSSGRSIVTANRYGTAELAGQAAGLVDPEELESIADGMRRAVMDRTCVSN